MHLNPITRCAYTSGFLSILPMRAISGTGCRHPNGHYIDRPRAPRLSNGSCFRDSRRYLVFPAYERIAYRPPFRWLPPFPSNPLMILSRARNILMHWIHCNRAHHGSCRLYFWGFKPATPSPTGMGTLCQMVRSSVADRIPSGFYLDLAITSPQALQYPVAHVPRDRPYILCHGWLGPG